MQKGDIIKSLKEKYGPINIGDSYYVLWLHGDYIRLDQKWEWELQNLMDYDIWTIVHINTTDEERKMLLNALRDYYFEGVGEHDTHLKERIVSKKEAKVEVTEEWNILYTAGNDCYGVPVDMGISESDFKE